MIIHAKSETHVLGARITGILVGSHSLKYNWENQTEIYHDSPEPITVELDNGHTLVVRDFLQVRKANEEVDSED